MCGIIGFTGPQNPNQLKQLQRLILHRGKDEITQHYQLNVNLGMNRLAINDLSAGLYPLKYKHYSLIYNGEIYNQKLLKKELKENVINFKTTCDGEVILPLFDKLGIKAFAKLEGMFALAIVDQKNKKLILARDKSGQKPLYYSNNKNVFSFSSEIKVLQKLLKTNSQLNLSKLPTYFREGSLVGQQTLLKNINKLVPASFLEVNLKDLSIAKNKYWHPRIHKPPQLNEKKLTDKLDELLFDSVSKRLLSDVPIGSFLSGGVDSSLITYYAAQKNKQFKTYSVVFPKYSKDDESFFSTTVAQKLNTNHSQIECTAHKALTIINKIGSLIDEPIIDPAVIPTYLISQRARKDIKVVLSGEGADELFGGYYRYPKHLTGLWIQKYFPQPFWEAIKPIVPKRISYKINKALTPLANYYSSQDVWTPQELKQLLPNINYQPQHCPPSQNLFQKNPFLAMQVRDYHHYLGEQLLMKIDKFTMLHNLEARAPFLDTKLINFAFSLPNKYKIKGINNKYLLRQVAARHLPPQIAWRPKKGFTVPLDDWYHHELKPLVKETILSLSHLKNIFNHYYLKQIVDEHLSHKRNHRDKIWSLIVLNQWLQSNDIQVQMNGNKKR